MGGDGAFVRFVNDEEKRGRRRWASDILQVRSLRVVIVGAAESSKEAGDMREPPYLPFAPCEEDSPVSMAEEAVEYT